MGNASSVSAQNGRKARRSTRLNEVFGFLHGGRVREEVGILTMCVQSGWRARDFVSSGHGYGRVRIRESAALLIDEIICLYLIDISLMRSTEPSRRQPGSPWNPRNEFSLSCKEQETFSSSEALRDENNANNRDTVNHVNESRCSVISHR